MPGLNIDFEGNAQTHEPQNPQTEEPKDINGNPSSVQDVDDNNNPDNHNGNNNEPNNNQNNEPNSNENNEPNGDGSSSTGEDITLNAGDSLEIDGQTYTVAENGDIVDANGNVFKAAADVQAWLQEQNVDDTKNTPTELNIQNIIDSVGVTITDDDENPIEFTDDAAGVKSYLDSVMNLRSKEIAEAAINKLFTDAPIVKDFIDYLTVNNGDPRGFGEIRDLSKVTLDKDNESQLESIIRAAAKEFGNASLSDSYIKYLKDSGGLYDEANRQLQQMINRDNAYRTEMEEQAKAQREQQEANTRQYWNDVSKKINGRNIAGYQIPESFIMERDGQKTTVTPSDFWDYLTRTDRETGMTGYRRDLNSMTDEQVMENELLDAWLHFTGKTYRDLIGMEAKQNEVRKLRIQSKNNDKRSSIKITRNQPKKVDMNSIILG